MRTDDERPRTVRPFIGGRGLTVLTRTIAVVGAIATVAGIGYSINGATQVRAGAHVSVPVVVTDSAGGDLRWLPGPPGTASEVAVVERVNALTERDGVDVWFTPADGVVVLKAAGGTMPEQLLSRGDSAVAGITIGIGTLLLVQLLRRVSQGTPFQAGQAARLAALAGLVLVEGWVGPLLPRLGAEMVLARLDALGGEGTPSPVPWTLDLDPLLLCGLLLVLAEVFRRGHATTREVEGLV